MGSAPGFMDIPRRTAGYRDRGERLQDWKEVEHAPGDDLIRKQAERCMNCGTPFCHAFGCPLANLIPDIHERVQQGRWRDALDLLLATGGFPEFTGRICPALCEGSCVLGINRDPVTIRAIERAVIEKGFAEGWVMPRPPVSRLGPRVAVIGSGPAGLAVADALNHIGYGVTLYDMAARAGGILRYGIPEFKLEKSVVDRRVRLMEAEGVRFELGLKAGEDVSARYLLSRFDAVCLTGGAREPRDLNVPGRELKGVHWAMDYLRWQNMRLDGDVLTPEQDVTAAGRHVVVIGGGDTGADCLGTALRQGARSVRQYEILPEPPPTRSIDTPWPMWPVQRRDSSSHQEGGERRWCVSTRAILGKDGRVAGVRGIDVRWTAGAAGRPAMQECPGTEFEVPADLVLLALGFAGPRKSRLLSDLGVAYDMRGQVAKDEHHMCSVAGVFAAGDLACGASLVVRAIADGRAAAESIHAWLSRGGRGQMAAGR